MEPRSKPQGGPTRGRRRASRPAARNPRRLARSRARVRHDHRQSGGMERGAAPRQLRGAAPSIPRRELLVAAGPARSGPVRAARTRSLSSPIPAIKSSPSACRARRRQRRDRDAVTKQRRAGERVRPTARAPGDQDPFESRARRRAPRCRPRVADRAALVAVGAAVAGPAERHQADAARPPRPRPGGVEQARAGRAVVGDHRQSGRVAVLADPQDPPTGPVDRVGLAAPTPPPQNARIRGRADACRC